MGLRGLRDYQRACVGTVSERNTLVVLPPNAGKTFIAAEAIAETLDNEEARVVVFLAPTAVLAEQQYTVLLERLGSQVHADAAVARRRLLLLKGGAHGSDDDSLVADEAQCLVGTPQLLVLMLTHGRLRMSDIALLVLDEAHKVAEAANNHPYSVLMRCFYTRCAADKRPRVLGLTATPLDSDRHAAREADDEAMHDSAKKGLGELAGRLDATLWTARPSESQDADAARLLQWPSFVRQPLELIAYVASDELDPHSKLVVEAVGRVAWSIEGKVEGTLWAAWERKWKDLCTLLEKIARELGARSCDRAARLLLDQLKLTHEQRRGRRTSFEPDRQIEEALAAAATRNVQLKARLRATASPRSSESSRASTRRRSRRRAPRGRWKRCA